jgi:hypothetical protein
MVPSKIPSLSKPLGQNLATLVDLGANFEKLGYQLIIVNISFFGIYIFYRSRRDGLDEADSLGAPSELRQSGKLLRAVQRLLAKKRFSDSLFELFGLTFAGLLFAAFIRSSPFIGTFYNLDRAAFQISLVWLLPFALFFEFLCEHKRSRVIAILTLSMMATGTLFTQLGLGTLYNGTYVSKISSVNSVADATVISAEENFSAQWVCQRLKNNDLLQSDSIANISLSKYPCSSQTLFNISPFVLDQNAFIFSNRANTVSGVTYDGFLFRRFNFPIDYITQYYEPIYTSDSTRIYH